MKVHHTLLLVEDEIESGEMLANFLELNNFKVYWAKDGKEAFKYIDDHADEIELAILDIMVPHHDGKEICANIRKHPVINEIPVLFLTARDEEKDEIEGLELGADDYIAKPFEPKELILRIQNIISKTKKKDQKHVVEFENIKIDLNKQIILKKDVEFKINNTEKIILKKMINDPGKIFSREDIGAFIQLDKERSIDVIITRLRKKIEIDSKNPKFLQTIRGEGYVLWIE